MGAEQTGGSESMSQNINPNLVEPRWLQTSLIAVALFFLLLMLVIPLTAVFYEALRGCWHVV